MTHPEHPDTFSSQTQDNPSQDADLAAETDQSDRLSFKPGDYPDSAGIYLMKNEAGRIIYVGKAKNLRKRLASYFRPDPALTPKTRALMIRVRTIETLLTATEKEALLLEASLIKKHRPRYNICLRDDKSYILFKLDKTTDYPRLTLTRKVLRDGSSYFGPFTSALAARETARLIGRTFPLRKCKDTAMRNRVRACLYHFIGQCPAPCVLDVPREEYARTVRRVEMLLSGRSGELTRQLEAEMLQASENLEFERAAALRDTLRAVARTIERQSVVLDDTVDKDIIGLAPTAAGLALGVLFVRRGRLIDGRGFFWPEIGLEEGPEVLSGFISQFYGPTSFIPKAVIAPLELDDPSLEELLAERAGHPVRIRTAGSDAERRLIDMAARNGIESSQATDQDRDRTVLANLAQALGLPSAPRRIECVDISHLAGEGARAGLTVFEDGRPKPDDYRIYKLSEAEGTRDDYLSMRLFMRRRLESGEPWPDLLLIDGGKGQLAMIAKALEESWPADLPPLELASIAKPSRSGRRGAPDTDRIFRPGRANPAAIRPDSREMMLLRRIRDATHRHVITSQRKSRVRQTMTGSLEEVPGIGPKTAARLWERFGAIERIRSARLEEIQSISGLGGQTGLKIHAALHPDEVG